MRNPNSPLGKAKAALKVRWSAPDYPGGEPRFQPLQLAKDVAVFLLLPALAALFSRAFEGSVTKSSKPRYVAAKLPSQSKDLGGGSQVISFSHAGKGAGVGSGMKGGLPPGSLVRLKLQNVVEVAGAAPVHAQVIGSNLGDSFNGGVAIGDATADSSVGRVHINFKLVIREGGIGALEFKARALSLNGVLGLESMKKEGIFARAAIGSAKPGSMLGADAGDPNLVSSLLKLLTGSLGEEIGKDAQVEKSRSDVLVLNPGTELFAELTDYFPVRK